MDYEKVARESGFVLEYSLWFPGKIIWMSIQQGIWSDEGYTDVNEAWKACCVENGLVEARS